MVYNKDSFYGIRQKSDKFVGTDEKKNYSFYPYLAFTEE